MSERDLYLLCDTTGGVGSASGVVHDGCVVLRTSSTCPSTSSTVTITFVIESQRLALHSDTVRDVLNRVIGLGTESQVLVHEHACLAERDGNLQQVAKAVKQEHTAIRRPRKRRAVMRFMLLKS